MPAGFINFKLVKGHGTKENRTTDRRSTVSPSLVPYCILMASEQSFDVRILGPSNDFGCVFEFLLVGMRRHDVRWSVCFHRQVPYPMASELSFDETILVQLVKNAKQELHSFASTFACIIKILVLIH